MPSIEYSPQLATLADTPPSGDEWLHEIKFDGYRIGASVRRGKVTLWSRSGRDWTTVFSDVAAAVQRLHVDDALIDGEIAVVLPDGRTSFQALQNTTAGRRHGTVVYFVFDLLRLDGRSIEDEPLERRKSRLAQLLKRHRTTRVRLSDHVIGRGDEFFQKACRLGLEGIVSKRRDSPYRPGRRAGWFKTKCIKRQEFVVGGFTEPTGQRAGLGALVIGYYDAGHLVCCGKVGTGFTQQQASALRATLDRIEQATCPFTPLPHRAISRGAHWVKPTLVCEVAFTEWTDEGSIRHPSFVGVRDDKRPHDVVREQPAPRPQTSSRRRAAPRSAPTPGPSSSGRRSAVVAGVSISHPDRVMFPALGLAKLDVAHYYEAIGTSMLPHVARRPLTVVRCPEGVGGECFFMKHAAHTVPAPLARVRVEQHTGAADYLIVRDVAGLVALAQMGVLEVHTWNSTTTTPERPNRLVFDLDPGEGVGWSALVDAARTVRASLAALDLMSFVKTTGGRGLHVVAPLAPSAGWDECLEFTRALSARLAAARPTLYTTSFSKTRRTRKILIDFLRNNRGNTSVSAYSPRARPDAAVSVPLTWKELERLNTRPTFNLRTVPARLSSGEADPWADYWRCRQRLTKQVIRAVLAT